jgi:hypothetical protein
MSEHYDNPTSQAERKAELKRDTYLSRAQASVGEELGGRFKHLARETTVTPQYPRLPPSHQLFANDPPEPPLATRLMRWSRLAKPSRSNNQFEGQR